MCFRLIKVVIAILLPSILFALDYDQYNSEIDIIKNQSRQYLLKYAQETLSLQKDSAQKIARNTEAAAKILNIPVDNQNILSDKNLKKYLFISLSIPKRGLIEILKQAKILGFIPILRGFHEKSYIKTVAILEEFIKEATYGVIIDPELFRKFEIKSVPSFVISREQICPYNMSCEPMKYNKLTGNVTVDYAFKTLLSQGELL